MRLITFDDLLLLTNNSRVVQEKRHLVDGLSLLLEDDESGVTLVALRHLDGEGELHYSKISRTSQGFLTEHEVALFLRDAERAASDPLRSFSSY